MTAYLIDTHVLAWSLIDPAQIAPHARDMLVSGAEVYVPPCCLYEIAAKVRKGAWDAMAPHLAYLDTLCLGQGFRAAPFSLRMSLISGALDWPHRDPFDRMIAATAIEMAIPLISKDTAFDTVPAMPGWVGRVWA
jgi:PIN domain nuclease of toxin-antitoxin system